MKSEITNETRLTGKQKRFADFYVGECSLNATRSAEKAGYRGSYGTLSQIGSENLRKPDIRKYIDDRLSKITATPSEILATLTRHMKGSLSDVLDEAGDFDLQDAKDRGVDGLIKKLKVTKKYDPVSKETETSYEYQIHDPQAAAVHLGKVHKLFADRVELTGKDGAELMPRQFIVEVVKNDNSEHTDKDPD